MARRNTQDFCILCGETPCGCSKPARKAAPRIISTPPPAPTVVGGNVEAPKRRVGLSGFRPPAPPVKEQPKILNTDTGSDDQFDRELGYALTNLIKGGLVPSSEDIAKHRNLIDLTDAEIVEIRANEWKKRKERRDRHTGKS